MTTTPANHAVSPSQAKGIALMTLAGLSYPLVDGIAKYLSASYSPLFIGWARYAAACLIVVPLVAVMRRGNIFPAERRALHVLRTVFLVTGMTLYFLAIARIPLATAICAFFVGPIIGVALSVILLKERMTIRKALSLALGFAGSIIILRPDGSLNAGILLALGAGVAYAFYLVTTRQASQRSDPLKTLAFQCVIGTLLLTPQATYAWSAPAWSDLIFFAGLGLFSALSHVLSIAAFRFADASTLSPLVYVELIGTALIGYFAFNEIPSAATLAGAAMIVAGGLVLLQRRNP